MLDNPFCNKEVVIKIEVKDNNVDQALRILKRKLQREGFFRILKIKSNYEKPSERKKREKSENIRRVKKIQRHVDGSFCLTYGDGVSDIDVKSLIQFHEKNNFKDK